jgi:murein DD-endopeptidase MepM/ murein hydrolase activator NlpD
MMMDIIQGQRIHRRKRSSFFPRHPACQPVDLTDQHPVRARRFHKKKRPAADFLFRRRTVPVSDISEKISPDRDTGADRERDTHKKTAIKKSGSWYVLFLFLGIAAAALGGTFLFQELYPELPVLKPLEGEGVKEYLLSYTGQTTAPVSPSADAIPLDLLESFNWESYTVARGDSISKIAAARSLSIDAIIASNGITNARRLRLGETLRIPNMDGIPYTVKKGDTLLTISTAQGVPLEAILDANDIQQESISPGTVIFIPGAKMKTEDLKLALGEFFIYPIRGALSSPYGWRNDPISGVRRYHAALDLAAPTGTPIKAAMDGRVATLGFNSVYGKYIIMSHSGGFQTLYAHMNATSVGQGAYIQQGVKIGEVGSTGYSTGPHLHFAVFKNGKAMNPLELLNP